MAQNSKIEWTDHTANLWHGCTKVHTGCDNCYAEALAKRWGNDIWGIDKPRKEIKSVWSDLNKYQKAAEAAGEMHRVFVGSMMDIFEKPMPLIDSKGNPLEYNTGDLRKQLFNEINDGSYPNLMFLLLTKRPSNINKYIPFIWKENPPKNVMFGTSPVDQATANKLVPQLLKVKGKRFLSVEPQLGHVCLTHIDAEKAGDKDWCFINALTGQHDDMARPCPPVPVIHWVIQGGESGHHKRPFNLEWAYDMMAQCKKAEIPYFFKQIDKIKEIPEDLMKREMPEYFKIIG